MMLKTYVNGGYSMNSIKTKYMVLLGTLMAIVCFGLAIASYITASNALQSVTNELISKTVDESAKVVSERINLRLAEVEAWANSPIIKDTSMSVEDKMIYLKKEVERGGYYSAGLGDAEGNVTTMAGVVINLKERPYIQSVLKGNYEVTDPIISREDNTTLIVNYTVPIKDQSGAVIGLVIGSRNGDELSQLTNDINIGETGNAFMVNKSGVVVAHPDIEKVKAYENTIELSKEDESLIPLARIIEKMVLGEKGVGDYTYNSVDKIVAYSPIPNSNWSIAVNVPKNEILSALNTLQMTTILISIIFLFAGVVFVYLITNNLVSKVKFIVNNLQILAKGDFTSIKQSKLKRGKDELDQAIVAMSLMSDSIRAMIGSVKNTSDSIHNKSTDLTQVSGEMTRIFSGVTDSLAETNKGISSQANSLTSISEILNNFGAKIDAVVKNIQDIDDNAKEIDQMSKSGNKDMTMLIESVETMSKIFKDFVIKVEGLGLSINQVTDITQMINAIAEQTNLLALNAAIEAARAGESGRGFAVVADEIRKLAEQSKQSSQNIDTLVNNISNEANLIIVATSGIDKELNVQVDVINTTIDSYKGIVNAINDIGSKIGLTFHSMNAIDREKFDIISKVEDASAVAEEVSATAEQISDSSLNVLDSAETVSSSALQMEESIKHMMGQINKFTI